MSRTASDTRTVISHVALWIFSQRSGEDSQTKVSSLDIHTNPSAYSSAQTAPCCRCHSVNSYQATKSAHSVDIYCNPSNKVKDVDVRRGSAYKLMPCLTHRQKLILLCLCIVVVTSVAAVMVIYAFLADGSRTSSRLDGEAGLVSTSD